MKRSVIFSVFIFFLVLGILPIFSSVTVGTGLIDDDFAALAEQFPTYTGCSCTAISSHGGNLNLNNNCYLAYDGDENTFVGGASFYEYQSSPYTTTSEEYRYTLTLNFEKTEINSIKITPGTCFNQGYVDVYRSGIKILTRSLNLYGNTLYFNNLNATSVVVRWSGSTSCYNTLSTIKEVKIDRLDESDCSDTDGGVEGEQEFINGTATGAFGGSETDQCYSTFFVYYHDRNDLTVAPSNACKLGDVLPYAYIITCSIAEAYCENGIAKTKSIVCPTGICYQGACGCNIDSDCAPGYTCEEDITYDKPAGGQGTLGACRLISCEDTDGGEDRNNKGTVTSEEPDFPGGTDRCLSETTLLEYYCSLGKGTSKVITCEADEICEAGTGACIPVGCGNGVIDSGEGCDDGNTAQGDGCDSACQIEDGYNCVGEPSVCTLKPCEEFTTNATCPQGCTWTPPGTISNPEGGCCPKEFPEWDPILGCKEGAVEPCTIPFTFSIANALKSGGISAAIELINQQLQISINDIDNTQGPLDIKDKQYCAPVSKEFNWGLWYNTNTY